MKMMKYGDVLDVVEAELVGVLGRSNDTNPVAEGVLLQELLGEVLEVALRDGDVRSDGQVGVACEQNETLNEFTTQEGNIPLRAILMLSPSWPVLPSTLMRSWRNFSKAAPSKTPSPAGRE